MGIPSGWDQALVGAGENILLPLGAPCCSPLVPCSHRDLIPPRSDPVWHPAPIHKVQYYSQPSAGAAGGREREARTTLVPLLLQVHSIIVKRKPGI